LQAQTAAPPSISRIRKFRALIERPYNCAPLAVGAVYDRPGCPANLVLMLQNIINPAKFSEIVGQVPGCAEADVNEALDRAQRAFETWSRTSAEYRASLLSEAACDLRNELPVLATLFVRENGKPLREALIDIQRSVELLEIIASDLPEWSKP